MSATSYVLNTHEKTVDPPRLFEIKPNETFQFPPELLDDTITSIDYQVIIPRDSVDAHDTISYNTAAVATGEGLRMSIYGSAGKFYPPDIPRFRARSMGSTSAWLYCEVRTKTYVP